MRYALLIPFALFALFALFIAGCGENGGNPGIVSLDASEADVQAVVSANNQFAFDLYHQLILEDGNLFFSPYSISTALAMTYEGARGDTAAEMKSVFHFPEKDVLGRGSNSMYHLINKGRKDYMLKTGNALWAQQDFPFLDTYLTTIGEVYGGRTTNVDFVNAPTEAVDMINSWVEDQTEDKIKDILSTDDLTPLTRLVLTNAIYFKGDWKVQFKEENTRDEPFYLAPGQPVDVPMMHLSGDDARFPYMENDDLQAIVLPYEGDEVSMMVLLPKGDDYNEIDDILSAEYLDAVKKQMVSRDVRLSLPKFKFETKSSLSDTLEEMGMPLAFDDELADFSGMTGRSDLYISSVIHQAYIDVNEEGTEAAAATVVVMAAKTSLPNFVEFKADHPFVFLIQENTSGNILFMGKVRDPRGR